MTQFLGLRDTQPASIRTYKKEVRAVVIDRAAFHVEHALAAAKKPTVQRYQAMIEDGLARAKLDVMAEIFSLMRDIARPKGVGGWTRSKRGLVRESRRPDAALDLIDAYSSVIRYVSRLRAKGRRQSR